MDLSKFKIQIDLICNAENVCYVTITVFDEREEFAVIHLVFNVLVAEIQKVCDLMTVGLRLTGRTDDHDLA